MSLSAPDACAALLPVLFAGTHGAPSFFCSALDTALQAEGSGTGAIESRDFDRIEAFLANCGTDLTTAHLAVDGRPVAYVLYEDDWAIAGQPALVLTNPESDAQIGLFLLDRNAEWAGVQDDDPYLFDLPLHGTGGWTLDAASVAQLEGDGDLPRGAMPWGYRLEQARAADAQRSLDAQSDDVAAEQALGDAIVETFAPLIADGAFEDEGVIKTPELAAVPMAGAEPVDSSLDALFDAAAEMQAGDPASSPEVESESSAEADDGPIVLNDAVMPDGIPPDDVLALPLQLGFGTGADCVKWPAVKLTFGELVGALSQHTVGKKDGKAFMQGNAIDNKRVLKAMQVMYLVGLDVDVGESIRRTVEKLKALNVCAVLYTTHSHMKTTTEVTQVSYAKWAKKNRLDIEPDDEAMQAYLRDAMGWAPEIADSAKVMETIQTVKGVGTLVEHLAMPKFRIVMPLAAPYAFAKQKGLMQQEAINQWKGRLLGLAKMLDLPIDESCLDPSRLFYLPRHEEGAAFEVIVTNGNALDFSVIPDANPRSNNRPDDDAFANAARELGASRGSLTFEGFSLGSWAAKYGDVFQLAEMLRASTSGRIRTDYNTSKVEIECPFDHEHSNAGDTEDRGCFAVDAHADGGDKGFFWSCRHNSCQGKGRLEMLLAALEGGWFSTDDLENEAFMAFTLQEVEEVVDPVQIYKDLTAEIEAADRKDPEITLKVEDILRRTAKARLNKMQTSGIISGMVRNGLGKAKAMTEAFQHIQRSVASTEDPKLRQRRMLADAGITVDTDKEVYVMDSRQGYVEQRKKTIEIIDRFNARHAKLFDFGQSKVYIEMVENYSDTRISPLDWTTLSNVLASVACYYKQAEDSVTSVPPPDRILKELVAGQDCQIPMLKGFATLPYYDAQARLITKKGYDPQSMIYHRPVLKDARWDVPLNPSPEQVQTALSRLLDDVYEQFPFDDGPETETKGMGSRAHFLAMLLQPFIRPMIQGPTPIYLVSKPTPGTGASLLIGTGLMISSGHEQPSTITETFSEEEIRKGITSAFRAGMPYYFLDNVTQELKSPAYANLATAMTWDDRLLGKSEQISFPNKMQVVMAGNNVRGTYEIMRRCLPIRLDAKRNPLTRKGFKYDPLPAYVQDHREELTMCVLTLINAWRAAGKPEFRARSMASFEGWSRVTGGILEVIGVPGFLSNLHLTQKLADDETRNYELIFQAWLDTKFQKLSIDGMPNIGVKVTAVQLAEMMIDMPEFPAIGIRYVEDAKVMSPRLREKLDAKVGAPYTCWVGEDRKTVCIKRTKNARSSQVEYALVEMVE